MNASVTKRRPVKRGRTTFPGIGKQAKALRVTRQHLFSVLSNERRSPTLLARWQRLVNPSTNTQSKNKTL